VNCHLMDTFMSLTHEELEQLHPSTVVQTTCTPQNCIMVKEIGTDDSEISNNKKQPNYHGGGGEF
jgi:hypothetical protein